LDLRGRVEEAVEKCINRSFMIYTPAQYCYGNQAEDNEMDGEEETCKQNFGLKTLREETTWKSRHRWVRIILNMMSKKLGGRLWTGLICFRVGLSGLESTGWLTD
jgi:hypothetical protein